VIALLGEEAGLRCGEIIALEWASRIHPGIRVAETSLTASAVSRDTMSDQAAGAGSHKPRVGGGGRVSVFSGFDVHASTLEKLSSHQ
jgi:hypothetical protein